MGNDKGWGTTRGGGGVRLRTYPRLAIFFSPREAQSHTRKWPACRCNLPLKTCAKPTYFWLPMPKQCPHIVHYQQDLHQTLTVGLELALELNKLAGSHPESLLEPKSEPISESECRHRQHWLWHPHQISSRMPQLYLTCTKIHPACLNLCPKATMTHNRRPTAREAACSNPGPQPGAKTFGGLEEGG